MYIKKSINKSLKIILIVMSVVVVVVSITGLLINSTHETYIQSELSQTSLDFTSAQIDVSNDEDAFEELSNDKGLSEDSELLEDESIASESEFEHGWVINEFGYTYVYNGCGYEQFNYKQSALNRYVGAINKIVSLLPESVSVYNITVPVCSTFVEIPREIYVNDNFYNQSQSAFSSTVASKLDKRITSVKLVNILEEKYDNNEYVYFRTDRNWTPLGAYYAYKQFCADAEIAPYSIDSFAKTDDINFLGSFYVSTENKEIERNIDTIICHSTLPSVKTTLTIYDKGMVYTDYSLCNNKVNELTAYNIFLGRDASRYEVSTTTEGKKLLIIGDTSVHPMISYLTSHYSRIDYISPEKYESSITDYLSDHSYDDCIIMCYTTNAVSGTFIPSLIKMSGETNE